MTDTDTLREALEKHYPEGMWKQPSGNTVLVCECGEKLWGVNRGACQAAWRLHVEQALATLSKPEPAAVGDYEARYVAGGVPTDCVDYGVVRLSAGKEVCRVWHRDDAEMIARLLNASPYASPSSEAIPAEQVAQMIQDAIATTEQRIRMEVASEAISPPAQDLARPDGTGFRPSDHAPAGHDASRFNPSRWMPIESAPKDGTHILICYSYDNGTGPRISEAFWRNDMPFVNDGCWWVFHGRMFQDPDHWMPLPAALCDSDGNPKGGNEVPSRSDDSAGRQASSEPCPPDAREEFNINEPVRVKLTEKGMDILRRDAEDLRAQYPSLSPWTPPAVDEEGYSEFQLWTLMRSFGEYIIMGCELPFETTIILKSRQAPDARAVVEADTFLAQACSSGEFPHESATIIRGTEWVRKSAALRAIRSVLQSGATQ